jgi:hypothetical protein
MNANRYFFGFFTTLLLLLPFLIYPAQAQDGPEPVYSGVWKVRPLQFGEYYVAFENVKETDQTNEIGIGYIYKSFVRAAEKDKNTLTGLYSNFVDDEAYTVSDCNGLIMRMSQRNYTSADREAPFGFYHGPAVTLRFIAFQGDLLRESPEEVIGRLYQGVLAFHYQVGYQTSIGKHLTLEVFGGVGARLKVATAKLSKGRVEERVIAPLKISPDNNSAIGAAPELHFNMSVGYAFK